jgi:hypothetical protein
MATIDLGSMTPAQNRPPARPGVTAGAPAIGSIPSGSSVTSQPTPEISANVWSQFGQAGQIKSGGLDKGPTGFVPGQPNDDTNVSSSGVPSPAAGDGPGDGRQPREVIGKTSGKTMPAGVKSYPQGGFLSQTGRK